MENKGIYSQYTKSKDTYELFGKKLVDLIEGLLKRDNIDYQAISYRVKSEDSFRNKVKKKNKYKDIKDMTDVCGIRIITYYSDTVDKVAEIISKQFNVDEKNTIDKRKALDPDRFGYLSLHYVVSLKDNRLSLPEYEIFKDIKVEIQIRSISQHAWAEIEHDMGYKSKKEIPKSIRRDFSRLASLLELVDKEFVEIRNKIDLYTDEVKVTIKTPSEETFIDAISLAQYINSSEELKLLDQKIEKLSNFKLIDLEYDSIIYDHIVELEFAGFKTIQQIDQEIKNNKDIIANIAKSILTRDENEDEDEDSKTNKVIVRNIGLFYLCYYKICQKESKDEIINFLNNANIDSRDPKDFSENLLNVYYDAIKNN